MSERVRVVIADDEPPARTRIAQLLEELESVQVVAECAHGKAAVESVCRLAPDLVFLDIQMPLLDGFEVVSAVGSKRMPPVIFVTAYDKYALRAFDVHAVDYLLKPFSRIRFREAVERALREVRHRKGSYSSHMDGLLAQLRQDGRLDERLAVQTGRKVHLVRVADIDWVEAAGNYVALHSGTERHLMRATMHGLGERLPAEQFVRLHRSAWVNTDRIQHLKKLPSGDFEVHLKGGKVLPGSRRYAAEVFARWRA